MRSITTTSGQLVSARDDDAGSGVLLALPFLILFSEVFAVPLGGIALTPLQAYLIALMVPAIIRMTQIRLHAADYVYIAYILWMCAMRTRNIGVVSAGIFFIEAGLLYAVIRAYMRTPESLIRLVRVYFGFVLVLGVLAVTESLSGSHFIADFVRRFDPDFVRLTGDERRLGLMRAGVITHPILYGVFCASMIGLVWYTQRSAVASAAKAFAMLVATFFSLSAGPLIAAVAQIGCVTAERVTRGLPNRATILVGGAAGTLAFLQVAAGSGILGVVAAYMTFTSTSAWYRQMIWRQVSGDIARNPIFGMNPANWSRRAGMSESIDAQWLVTPLTAGMPAIVLLALSFLVAVRLVFRRTDAEVGPDVVALRRGWTYCMLGLIIAGFAVAYFSILQPQFHLVLAIGFAVIHMAERSNPAVAAAAPAPPRPRAAIGDILTEGRARAGRP